jgi:hypothetical protein
MVRQRVPLSTIKRDLHVRECTLALLQVVRRRRGMGEVAAYSTDIGSK